MRTSRLGRVSVAAITAVLLASLMHSSAEAQVADRPAHTDRSATAPAPLAARARPRLAIARIGVNARIRLVGVRNGQLAVTGSTTDVYRWRQGVRPGQPGSAVIAGHTWAAGDGVFDNLGRLRKGNRIRVGRHKFRVTRVQRVRSMTPRQVRRLYSDRGRPRLVLITCGDRDAGGVYRTRILVRARKITAR